MKKGFWIFLIGILIAIFILGGCAAPAPTPSPAPTPTPTPAPTPAPSGPIELKIGTFGSMQSSGVTVMFGPWAKAIEEATGGKVKFTIYAGNLVKQAELYDAVESGLADIALFVPDMTPGRFPRAEINVLPGLYKTAKTGGPALHKVLEKYCFNTEMSKVKVLFLQPFPPMALAATKPIQKLEDFKGLKIGAEGKVESWYVEALGAQGVRFSLPEVYGNLERNLMDAINFSWEAIMIFGVKDVTKYHINSQSFARGFVGAMNLDKWNKLPPDIKAIFEKNIGVEKTRQIGESMDGLMAGFKKGLAEYDAKVGNPPILELSDAEMTKWQAVYTQIQNKWIEDREKEKLPAKDMMKDFQTFLNEYSK